MKDIKEETKKSSIKDLHPLGKISLWLDRYEDIFSDFDPRPFSERALSVDFLDEAKRASREKKGNISVNLLIPLYIRDLKKEITIKKRLKEHFKKHYTEVHEEYKKVLRRGFAFVISGIVLMFIATFILFTFKDSSLLTTFLVILLEPGGWFLFWEGLDLIIFESKKKKPSLDFYKKMSRAFIEFDSY